LDCERSGLKQSWRIRRRLIHMAVVGGFGMIVVGGIGLFQDRFTGELVYGGVTLVTAVISAYTGFATFDDKWQGEATDG